MRHLLASSSESWYEIVVPVVIMRFKSADNSLAIDIHLPSPLNMTFIYLYYIKTRPFGRVISVFYLVDQISVPLLVDTSDIV